MGRAIDRTGQAFGCLVILDRAPNALDGPTLREYACWECYCGRCGGRPVYRQEHFRKIERGKYPQPERCKLCPSKRAEEQDLNRRIKEAMSKR